MNDHDLLITINQQLIDLDKKVDKINGSVAKNAQDIVELRNEYHQDIAEVNEHRWKMVGGVTALAFVVSVGVSLLVKLL